MLEISAISVLVVLTIKELVSANGRYARVANFLYLPLLPLITLFGIAAYERIVQLPVLY
jgi:hypothetical protein